MALRDFNVSTYSPEHVEANQAEARLAHERNGSLVQRDWWKISGSALANNFRKVDVSDVLQFIIDADIDMRHVAILCSPQAHIGSHEISRILCAAPVDGSTILAAYLYALSDILEGYYSTACRISNYHPFIKNGEANWATLSMGENYDDHMVLLAELWETSEQQILFDAGRKQILYAALEADLEANGIKPDWFIPSQSFLPFKGREANTNLIMSDWEIYEIPDTGFDWYLKEPERPKSSMQKLFSKLFH